MHNWEKLMSGQFCVLDTETTGLDGKAEIVEISIVADDGAVLLNTLVKPSSSIPAQATAVHHITNQMVRNAPTWLDIVDQYNSAVRNNPVLVYNAVYDSRIIRQTYGMYGMTATEPLAWVCIMEQLKQMSGMRKWLSLDKAAQMLGASAEGELHRSLTDTKLALAVARKMAYASFLRSVEHV